MPNTAETTIIPKVICVKEIISFFDIFSWLHPLLDIGYHIETLTTIVK